MKLTAALIYWAIVPLWIAVLGTILAFYIRNPRVFGTTRLLLFVVAIDTLRNIIENVYFGLYFGGQYGLFPASFVEILGKPVLLIIPKIMNIAAGCLVLALLLLRWLPAAVKERSKSEQDVVELETLAALDGLTGLYNRRQFDLLARAEWARFQRHLRPVSLLIIDIDHFKSVNDRFGHEVGDRMLKLIATTCRSAKRDSDIVGRIGGEEFAVLMPETDEAAARIVAERLLDQVRKCSPIVDDEKLHLTVSIGISSATLSMSSVDTLMKRADNALYEAKRNGRDRAEVAFERSKLVLVAATA